MKNYLLLSFIFSVLFVLSCDKDKECELNGTGEINLINDSSWEYEITLNMDSTFLIQPGEETTFTVKVGEHSLIGARTDALGQIIPTIGFNPTVETCKTSNLGIDN